MELVPHSGSTDGWATLIAKSFPLIHGNSSEDVSWECLCGRQLGVGLYARQLLNVLIECGECTQVLESPRRLPGEPIPGAPLYLEPGGRYLLGEALNVVDKPVAIVGRGALFDYAHETGQTIPGVYSPDSTAVISALDADAFNAIACQLRDLLGDGYESLRGSDDRGRRSKTPPAYRHRILELIDFASDAAAEVGGDRNGRLGEIDGNLLAEALTVLAVTRRWQHHPAWPTLRASLASDGEAPHTTMLLTVASYLADAGNGVGIYTNSVHQRASTADLWVEPDLRERVDIEIKAPVALRGPRGRLSESQATTILQKALKKSERQRRNTRSSFLVVGGYHLGPSFDRVVSTAQGMLDHERHRWRSLGGIIVADCTFEAHVREGEGSQTLSPAMRVELALHPGYKGELSVDVSARRLAQRLGPLPRESKG